MTDFEGLIHRLSAAGVQYVLVGGFAAAVHGSPPNAVVSALLEEQRRES